MNLTNAKTKILLVEDDLNLGTLLREYLSAKGFEVIHAFNGEEGFARFTENKFDICLLDVMMPKMDGFTLARKIRAADKHMPFLFLTAKSMLDDKIEGFKIGADDYVTKPFSMEELIMRIHAIISRAQNQNTNGDNNEFTIGEYNFNYNKRILAFKDKQQRLTSRECELLKLLCLNENQVLERTEALTRIWKDDNYFTSRSMDVYITKLRGYLKDDSSVELINVHGTGYKLITR